MSDENERLPEDAASLIPSVLACDVGNTSISFAHVKGEKVAPVSKFRIGELAGLGEAIARNFRAQMPSPRKIVAAGVNPAGLKALEAAVAQALGCEPVLAIGRDLPLPIDTDLAKPEKTGVDRLCAAAAAFDRLGVACVVADFGTAVTVDCVNDDGVFLGGAIMPGLAMGAAALAVNTAQLPKVALANPQWVFGKDTGQAILTGLVVGARGALRELVETYANELGHWPIVIITGGDAGLICRIPDQMQLVQAVVPDLVIRGVAAGYYRTLVK